MARPSRERSLATVTWVSACVALVMIAQQIASKAIRDGFFLDAFDVTALPYAAAAASLLSFLAAIVLGRVMRNFPPDASVPVIFGVNALLFFLEARFIGEHGRWIAGLLYLHIAAFSGAVVSGFWSVINERFDPFTAKKVVGKVAGGATVGGMVGGAATWVVADIEPSQILDGLGVANLVCGLALSLVGRGKEPQPTTTAAREPAGLLDGVRVLATKSYPRTIALLVFLVALTIACFDYVFKAAVTQGEGHWGSLVGFFAIFYTATGVATFVVQAVGSRHVLKWLGVVPTLAVLPIVVVVFLLGALAFPGLWAVVLLRGAAMVVENSLYRSGYELLYTPVPKEEKRSAKILIDLGCDRLGGAVGAGIALVAIAAAAALASRFLIAIALILALLTMALLFVVRKNYIAALATRIRQGAGSSEPSRRGGFDDYQAMASTFVGGGVSFQLPSSDAVGTAGSSESPSVGTTQSPPVSREELVSCIRAHGRARAHARAAVPAVQPAQVSLRLLTTPLLELLSRAIEEDESGGSWAELGASAPGTIGQLTDILLSTRHDLHVRLLAAELLSSVPTERTVAGLKSALQSTEFRIRRVAALALLRIALAAPEIRPTKREMVALADRELRHPTARAIGDSRIELASRFRTDAAGLVISPSLEHVFTLLAVAGDPDALRLALTAVTSADPAQRGTGLEYLDNLLPIDVRARLVALVEQPEQVQESARLERRVFDELSQKFRSREIDLAELRRRFRRELRTRYDSPSVG